MSNLGKYIALEGGEGSGKTTILKILKKRMDKINMPYLKVVEPGSTDLSENIRNLLLHSKEEVDLQTELFLFMAARSDVLHKQIMPALHSGINVVSDRCFISSVVYQTDSTMPLDEIYWMNKRYFRTPDLIFFLDITPEKAFERKSKEQHNRFEHKGKEFHEGVYHRYKALASKGILIPIDATLKPEKIVDKMMEYIASENKNIV